MKQDLCEYQPLFSKKEIEILSYSQNIILSICSDILSKENQHNFVNNKIIRNFNKGKFINL